MDAGGQPVAVVPEVLDDFTLGGDLAPDVDGAQEGGVLREVNDEAGQAASAALTTPATRVPWAMGWPKRVP